MDKEIRRLPNVRHKSGFALLITLSVLTVVIALTATVLGYFGEAKKDADRSAALLQANLFYATISKGFGSIPQQKELLEFLYETPIPLATSDGRSALLVSCRPASSGVNINWLPETDDTKMELKHDTTRGLFEYLVQEFEVRDPMMLEEMLIAEIEKGNSDVTGQAGRLRQKNGIISLQQFDRILTDYQVRADDTGIGKVPWSDYFSFTGEKIDAEYASAALIAHLFEIDPVLVEEWKEDIDLLPLEQFVVQNGGDYTVLSKIITGEKEVGESLCRVEFTFNMHSYGFSFYYAQGEAKYFEFDQ